MAPGRGRNEAARERRSQLARASAPPRLATFTNSAAVPGIATPLAPEVSRGRIQRDGAR